jgi:hypothetical protein
MLAGRVAAWEVETKAWFSEARIIVAGRRYQTNFHDLKHLIQHIEGEFERGQLFFEPNLVVVQTATRIHAEVEVSGKLQKLGHVRLRQAEQGRGLGLARPHRPAIAFR